MSVKDYNLFNTGKFYYQWGRDVIGVYPTPTEVKKIRIHYISDVSDMVKGDDEPHKVIFGRTSRGFGRLCYTTAYKKISPTNVSFIQGRMGEDERRD